VRDSWEYSDIESSSSVYDDSEEGDDGLYSCFRGDDERRLSCAEVGVNCGVGANLTCDELGVRCGGGGGGLSSTGETGADLTTDLDLLSSFDGADAGSLAVGAGFGGGVFCTGSGNSAPDMYSSSRFELRIFGTLGNLSEGTEEVRWCSGGWPDK
jgi:hypothetical protein